MGLFKKKEKKEAKDTFKLPDLPKLPELPSLENSPNLQKTTAASPSSSTTPAKESLPQLPSFPNNTVGQKFSQDSIKEAVTGKKEVKTEVSANEFELPKLKEAPMMQEPLKPMRTKEVEEYEDEIPVKHEFKHSYKRPSRLSYTPAKKEEPVFIRIDKFEESLKIFEKTKEQVHEIEQMLKETKELKEKEGEELVHWENQIQSLKEQVEKVDRDLFSKIE